MLLLVSFTYLIFTDPRLSKSDLFRVIIIRNVKFRNVLLEDPSHTDIQLQVLLLFVIYIYIACTHYIFVPSHTLVVQARSHHFGFPHKLITQAEARYLKQKNSCKKHLHKWCVYWHWNLRVFCYVNCYKLLHTYLNFPGSLTLILIILCTQFIRQSI